MEENIDPTLAKLLRWAQKDFNLEFPESYDKDKIVDIANYICKEHLSYSESEFVSYASKLNFPKHTIEYFVKQINKAMKRKSHPIRYINPQYILSLDI